MKPTDEQLQNKKNWQPVTRPEQFRVGSYIELWDYFDVGFELTIRPWIISIVHEYDRDRGELLVSIKDKYEGKPAALQCNGTWCVFNPNRISKYEI